MKGHRTDWEDGNEGTQYGLGRRKMKGHKTDMEDGNEGTQNGLGRRQ